MFEPEEGERYRTDVTGSSIDETSVDLGVDCMTVRPVLYTLLEYS